MSASRLAPHASPITGVILAGGQGRRMGSVDKGLQLLRGKPMVQWVIERFAPQVDEVLINANQNLETYGKFGYKVVPDEIGGFAGPLAGLHRGLSAATHELIATVPCDSPFLPLDLIERLYAALTEKNAELAVARTGDQPHPVFCLCRKSVLPGLTAFLQSGGRKIDAWYSALQVVEVQFDDEAEAFSNINTPEELDGFESNLTSSVVKQDYSSNSELHNCRAEEFIPLSNIPKVIFEGVVADLANFSVGFARVENTPEGQNVSLLGSGTLVAIGGVRAILTAHHVVEVLPRVGRLGLILSPTLQQHTIHTQGLVFLEIDRGIEDVTGPDLGAIVLSPTIAGSIEAKKAFYNLDSRRDKMLNAPPDRQDGFWFINGFVDERTVEEPGNAEYSRIKRFFNLSGAGGPSPAIHVGPYDYFAFPVSYKDQSVAPKSFGGMSGGGLWQIRLTRDEQGELAYQPPILSGVVFYQEPTINAQCNIKCHGIASVYRIAYDAIQKSGIKV